MVRTALHGILPFLGLQSLLGCGVPGESTSTQVTRSATSENTEASDELNSEFRPSISNGVLNFTPDRLGNVIPDFSYVGYRQGDVPIPSV